MDTDFPVTTLPCPQEFELKDAVALSVFVCNLIDAQAIATDPGGFYVRIACTNPPADVDYATVFNKRFDAHDQEWRLEVAIQEPEHLVLLFRMIDMNEILRVF